MISFSIYLFDFLSLLLLIKKQIICLLMNLDSTQPFFLIKHFCSVVFVESKIFRFFCSKGQYFSLGLHLIFWQASRFLHFMIHDSLLSSIIWDSKFSRGYCKDFLYVTSFVPVTHLYIYLKLSFFLAQHCPGFSWFGPHFKIRLCS